MEEKITIGTLQKLFGLKGEIRGKSMTSFPELRFQKGRRYFLLNPKTKEEKEYTLASFRPSGDYFFIRFEGIDTIEDAALLYGQEIRLPLEEAPLPDGYYRLSDLVGMKVLDDETKEELGTVKDVLNFSSVSTVKAVRPNGKTFTFPFLFDKFITNLDIEKKEMAIHVIPGLL